MRDLEVCGVIADVDPNLTHFVFDFEIGSGVTFKQQLATFFVIDVFGFDFQHGIRLVVVVKHLFHIDVHEAWHLLERAFFNLHLRHQIQRQKEAEKQ